jgi:hypothetical protein
MKARITITVAALAAAGLIPVAASAASAPSAGTGALSWAPASTANSLTCTSAPSQFTASPVDLGPSS